ncbi:TolC family protein [Planctomycetota bacterium]
MLKRKKKDSFHKFKVLLYICFLASITGFLSACKTPEQLVTQADVDSYEILEEKWQDDFGEMVNYEIRDDVADINEILAEIPSSGIISLADAVEIATKFSRQYQSQKESLYTSALNLTLTRHNYARQWFGTFDAEYRNSRDSEDNSVSSSAGVSQQFVTAAGIIANAGLSLDWTRFLSGDPYTSLGSVLSASVTAPLLGNVAGKQAWESLTQAERNVLYQIRSFNRYRQTFVVSIINSYYNVLQQRERLEITRASYERQALSTERLRMEVEVGQRAQSEADRQEQSLLSAENNLVSTEQNYLQTLDSFKVSLSLPTEAEIELDPNELVTLGELGVAEPEYSVEDAIEMALERRLDLVNTRDRLDDTRRGLILAADGLGVQAVLTGSTNVTSPSGETNFTNLEFRDGTYTLGVGVDLTFDQVSERNNYRRALISMQSALRGYDEEIENIKLAVRQAYRNLIETAESYEIQQIGVELAERRVQEQQLLMEFGRGTVETLLAAEDDLVSAQNSLTSALVSHLNAKLSFFRDIGILAVKPDGMWEQRIK